MHEKKINVGILFGGKSTEHEVSLQSAKNIFTAIDKEKYNPILIGIDKSGKWHLLDEKTFLLESRDPAYVPLHELGNAVALIPGRHGEMLPLSNDALALTLDVIFPILHGPLGEDGTVQGLLKLADVPFVGAGVLGSAVGIDKDVMKRLLRDAHLPIGKFIALRSEEAIPEYESIRETIGIPCFIKPANLGSSVGVSKAHNEAAYRESIRAAFQYDSKILIEEYIQGRELECAVLGNADPIASTVGEVVLADEFYSYETKYIDGTGARIEIPAKISDTVLQKIQTLAVQTFQTLSCEGLGRVDVFLTDKDEIIVNEINTLPGFTEISMYPKLWEASGIPYTELIDRLIGLAMERFRKEQKLQTSYTRL
ncbi:MAG: D-alanine--D-alanine ligase [Candidatus Moraniibacteriota bacterium]